ncbi:epoxide hydrolase [Xylariaceae sp. FL0804]|nr:epoxide hydrolase [Xylariaceae sp. FL0804]
MDVDALKPDDPRVEHKFTTVDGHRYHYMLARPEGNKPAATVVLCHGFPDLAMGWRCQVPFLVGMNLQVVVPDMLGYGQTAAPDSPDEYTYKKMAGHMAHLIREVSPDEPIILGGHDWGGFLVWRLTIYYPELIKAVFSICVPYGPPSPVAITLEQMVEKLPNFRYQLQFASGATEKMVMKSPERIRGFINGMTGGRTPEGEPVFSTRDGIVEERLERAGPSPLVAPEYVDLYAREYARNGLHGPLNWYRTRGPNAADEAELARVLAAADGRGGGSGPSRIRCPAMLVMAEKDGALPTWMAEGQEKHFEAGGLRRGLVAGASHWAMIQKPAECNRYIGDFVRSVLEGSFKASL